MEITWRVISGEEEGESVGKGTGNKKHNQQAQNRQGEVKNSIGNVEAEELTCMTHGHELKWGNVGGRGCEGQRGGKGGKWDNYNSIINKIYLKALKNTKNWLRCCETRTYQKSLFLFSERLIHVSYKTFCTLNNRIKASPFHSPMSHTEESQTQGRRYSSLSKAAGLNRHEESVRTEQANLVSWTWSLLDGAGWSLVFGQGLLTLITWQNSHALCANSHTLLSPSIS